MKDQKFTKGPWEVFDRSSFLVVDSKHRVIVNTSISMSSGNQTEVDEEAMGNGRLISAAPELLEELQKFVHSIYTGCSKKELEDLRISAESVIKKALGE